MFRCWVVGERGVSNAAVESSDVHAVFETHKDTHHRLPVFCVPESLEVGNRFGSFFRMLEQSLCEAVGLRVRLESPP